MDNGLVQKNLSVVLFYSLIMLLLVIVDQSITLLETKFYVRVNNKFKFSIFKDAFRKLLRFQQDFFGKTNYSEIVSNLSTDINNISGISDRGTFILINQFFRFVVGIVGLVIISWQLTLLVLLIAPVKFGVMKIITRRREAGVEDFIEKNRDFYSWFGEIINGIKEIKLWSLQKISYKRFIEKQRNIIRTNTKLSYLDNINQASDAFLFQLVNSLLYIFGGIFLLHGSITIGGIYALISYSTYVSNPISAVLNLRYNYANVIPSAKRFFKFIDNKTESRSFEKRKIRFLNPENADGDIEFRDVSFAYNDRRQVLCEASFTIRRGEKVALLGENGSGKTTILNLLLRFMVPNTGAVYYGGTDINSLSLHDYRKLFSVVCQDPYIFNTTIRDNVDLARTHTYEEMVAACEKSKAKDFIENTPHGYDSVLGRNGSLFSGGERQKIAVARAFLNDAPIVIFDEAASNFDVSSDEYLNQSIFNELSDKTVIVVSHNPSVAKYMDRILYVSDGKISEISVDQSAVRSI